MNYIAPRVTHYPDTDDPSDIHEAKPLCGASVFDSITRSVQVCSTFSDCDRCRSIHGGA